MQINAETVCLVRTQFRQYTFRATRAPRIQGQKLKRVLGSFSPTFPAFYPVPPAAAAAVQVEGFRGLRAGAFAQAFGPGPLLLRGNDGSSSGRVQENGAVHVIITETRSPHSRRGLKNASTEPAGNHHHAKEHAMQMNDILAQLGGFQSMARELGVSESQVATGAEALVPAILGGFKKQVQSAAHGSGRAWWTARSTRRRRPARETCFPPSRRT